AALTDHRDPLVYAVATRRLVLLDRRVEPAPVHVEVAVSACVVRRDACSALPEVVREPAGTRAEIQHRHTAHVSGESVVVDVGADVVVAAHLEAVVEVVAVVPPRHGLARELETGGVERAAVRKTVPGAGGGRHGGRTY